MYNQLVRQEIRRGHGVDDRSASGAKSKVSLAPSLGKESVGSSSSDAFSLTKVREADRQKSTEL